MGGAKILGASAAALLVALGGLVPSAPASAGGVDAGPVHLLSDGASSRRLLDELPRARERRRGYDREKFADWTDRDGDGCDTRDEVLIREAVQVPVVDPPGCSLSGGRWFSVYDGVTTPDPSSFDIDHLVPLAEAWDAGARRWTAGTRDRFANDLAFGPSLVAVTASSNRSKGDQEPHDWMPPRASHRCTYLARWVAVKWRWRLRVDGTEQAFLADRLAACGWPRVRTPERATVRLR